MLDTEDCDILAAVHSSIPPRRSAVRSSSRTWSCAPS